jgi:hypothetical protein
VELSQDEHTRLLAKSREKLQRDIAAKSLFSNLSKRVKAI